MVNRRCFLHHGPRRHQFIEILIFQTGFSKDSLFKNAIVRHSRCFQLFSLGDWFMWELRSIVGFIPTFLGFLSF